MFYFSLLYNNMYLCEKIYIMMEIISIDIPELAIFLMEINWLLNYYKKIYRLKKNYVYSIA